MKYIYIGNTKLIQLEKIYECKIIQSNSSKTLIHFNEMQKWVKESQLFDSFEQCLVYIYKRYFIKQKSIISTAKLNLKKAEKHLEDTKEHINLEKLLKSSPELFL